MKTLFICLAFIAPPLLSAPSEEETAFIENVLLKGRTLIHSCSYFSNAETELKVEFKSGPVDQGTKVFVEFGWEGSDQTTGKHFTWLDKRELELEQGPFTSWSGSFARTIAERSSPITISDVNFVFRIEEPGKTLHYVGGTKSGDTYVGHLPKVEDSACVKAGEELPPFSELIVQIVQN